jgi:hypothetical protein
MLNVAEQKSVLAMTDKIVRAALLANKEERRMDKTGKTYDEVHRPVAQLREQMAELLKEIG